MSLREPTPRKNQVIERIRTCFGEQVVWMRPSDITNRYRQAGGWSFLGRI